MNPFYRKLLIFAGCLAVLPLACLAIQALPPLPGFVEAWIRKLLWLLIILLPVSWVLGMPWQFSRRGDDLVRLPHSRSETIELLVGLLLTFLWLVMIAKGLSFQDVLTGRSAGERVLANSGPVRLWGLLYPGSLMAIWITVLVSQKRLCDSGIWTGAALIRWAHFQPYKLSRGSEDPMDLYTWLRSGQDWYIKLPCRQGRRPYVLHVRDAQRYDVEQVLATYLGFRPRKSFREQSEFSF